MVASLICPEIKSERLRIKVSSFCSGETLSLCNPREPGPAHVDQDRIGRRIVPPESTIGVSLEKHAERPKTSPGVDVHEYVGNPPFHLNR